MASFLTGFASTFGTSMNQEADRQATKDNEQFKYKMDALMTQNKRRQAKQDEETELSAKAASIAKSVGADGDGAVQIHDMMRGGVTGGDVVDAFAKGVIVPNENYSRTNSTIAMPDGVDPSVSSAPLAAPTTVPTSGGYRDPMVSAPNSTPIAASSTTTTPDALTPQFTDAETKRVNQIDPTLLAQTKPTVSQAMESQHTSSDSKNLPYKFNTTKEQKNLPDLTTLLYKQQQARNSNDPKALRDANDQVDSATRALAMTQKYSAAAAGQNVGTYLVTDDKGYIQPGGMVTAEVRDDPDSGGKALWNIGNGPGREQQVTGRPVMLTKENKGVERYNDIQDKFGTRAQEYKDGATNYISALSAAQQMEEIAKRNPSALTQAGSWAEVGNKIGGDLQPLWGQISQLGNAISSDVMGGKFNADQIEGRVNQYNKAVDDFLSKSLLSPGNEQLAIDAARYRAAQTRLAINLAAANGNSQSKQSDKDYQNMLNTLGGENGRSNVAIPTIHDALTGTLAKLDAMRAQLNSDGSVKSFERDFNVKTGLNGDDLRIGNMIQGTDDPNDPNRHAAAVQKMQYFNQINNGFQAGKSAAGEAAAQQSSGNSSLTKDQPDAAVPVKTKEDFDKLPSGVLYIAPDGTVRRKK